MYMLWATYIKPLGNTDVAYLPKMQIFLFLYAKAVKI